MKHQLWAIEEFALREYDSQRSTRIKDFQEKEPIRMASTEEGESLDSLVRTKKNIIVYEINGVLKPELDFIDTYFGGAQSYSEIEEDFEKIRNNSNIKGVLLSVSSPGGSGVGYGDAMEAMKNLGKPIVGFVNSGAYSMGYNFLAIADHIVAGKTAFVGSIGVFYYTMNYYDNLVDQGIRPVVIRGGQKKNKPFPLDPYDKNDYAEMEARVNEEYDLFVSEVATNRKIAREKIYATEGRILKSQEALDLGLIDTIGSKQDALKHLKNLIDQKEISGQQAVVKPLPSNSTTMEVKKEEKKEDLSETVESLKTEMETLRSENAQLKDKIVAFEKRENDRIEAQRTEILNSLQVSCKSPSLMALYQKASLEELQTIKGELDKTEEEEKKEGEKKEREEGDKGAEAAKPPETSAQQRVPVFFGKTVDPNLTKQQKDEAVLKEYDEEVKAALM